jgi:hypothetical protein
MTEVSRCANCGQLGVINRDACQYCDFIKPSNRGFFKWFIKEFLLDYRCICFLAVSVLNGIFMKHFYYSEMEIIVQTLCLGIILPGLFKGV